jgi:type IV pilus assembly protein PilX
MKLHLFASSRQNRQSGISLAVVMIFLIILSILGITIIQGSTFGSKIARNESDRNLAFQAAEAALRDAENDIKYRRSTGANCTLTDGCRVEPVRGENFDASCTNGLCEPSSIPGPVWETASRWATTGSSVAYGTYTGATALPLVVRQPRYLIEYFKQNETTVLRVTAVGFGASESTRTMLQTSVKVL